MKSRGKKHTSYCCSIFVSTFCIYPLRGVCLSAFIKFLVILVEFNIAWCLMVLQKLRATGGLVGNEHRAMFCGAAYITCSNSAPFCILNLYKPGQKAETYVSMRYSSSLLEEECII
jgi:hypothetical protein